MRVYVLEHMISPGLSDVIVAEVMEEAHAVIDELSQPAWELVSRKELLARQGGRAALQRWESGGDAATLQTDLERVDARDKARRARPRLHLVGK